MVDQIKYATDVSKLFLNETELKKLDLIELTEYYNTIVEDFNLIKYQKIKEFKSTKQQAIERIEAIIWIASMMVEKNNLQNQVENMLSLKINTEKLSEVEKLEFVKRIFENRIETNKLIQFCNETGFEKKIINQVFKKSIIKGGKEQKNKKISKKELKKIEKKNIKKVFKK